MTPDELVLTIIDMHQRHAPMATILTVAARALRAERERAAQVALNVRMDARNLAVWEVRDRIAAAIRALD